MIKMDYKGKITNQEIPLFEGNNAYLRDFAISNDENAPITAGLFRLEKGDSITYEYTYEEMKLIIDGEFHISDGSGEEVTATVLSQTRLNTLTYIYKLNFPQFLHF